ncbi:hypothetical protein DSL64_11440 [Dyadobacter luteus]|uniref:Uncharacterized protein n=1 Tax=Dyadobacter luteus TaxID=2259619 RepID=A0A3D8YCK7_9BACT|nr:hypothetical protein [Dyadobacter luteus]REA61573.1 hypothetical protein DSL64_11440 [Dyadobacter luteus]
MTKGVLRFLIVLIIAIPVVIYFTAWDYYAINIPLWDDHPLKGFVDTIVHATTWDGRIQALIKQHNEHRIALTRLVAWADFSLFGSLNYRHLMFIGNLLLLGIPALWFVILKNNKKPLFALVPVPFLLFTLALWENTYWGMASIQNFGVVMLVMWTIYLCVNPSNVLFALSLPLAFIAVFTSPNALFVFPVGALLIFLTGNRKRLALFVSVALVTIFCFFKSYNRVTSNPESKAGIFQMVKGYMAYLGSFAESVPVLDNFRVCLVVGCVLFLVAVSIASTTLFRIIRNKYSVKYERITDLFCLGAILFILGTALVVVYSRAGFGIEGLIASKYKIYSILLLLVAYLYVVIPIRGSFLSSYITAIVFFAVVFNIFSYHYHLVDAFNHRKMLITSQFNSTYDNRALSVKEDTSFVANVKAKTPVIYEKWLPQIAIADRQSYAGTSRGMVQLFDQTSFKKETNSLRIENTSFTSQRLQDSGIYILLRSKDRYYIFPTVRNRNKSRKQLFLKQYYFAPGFHADIPFSAVDKGTYDIALLRQDGEQTGILYKNVKVDVPEVEENKIKVNW